VDQVDPSLIRSSISFVSSGKIIPIDHEFLSLYLKFITGIHDFGKISRPFQQKIHNAEDKRSPKLDSACVPFSYHAQIGGLFTWLLLEEFLEFLQIRDDIHLQINIDDIGNLNDEIRNLGDQEWEIRDYEDLDDDLSKIQLILSAIGSLSVLMHHHKGLDNYSDSFTRESNGQKYDVIIHAIISDIRTQFDTSLLDVETIFGGVVDHLLWRYCFTRAFSKLIHLKDEDLEELLYTYDESCTNVLPEVLKERNDPFFTLFFSFTFSLLCDADEWDAKSYIEDSSDHRLEFEQALTRLAPELISNYRKVRFSNYTSRSNGEAQLINLRNSLYKSVVDVISGMSDKKIARSLFFIDAATGAAKTLALLQAGLMLRTQKNPEPRIIYALPFISIIEQVGKEITEIYKENRIEIDPDTNNQLLVLHHHLNDSSWVALETEEVGTIIFGEELSGYANHHYINNWHPEVIVTSFVKLLNTLVKAHKREFIRAHRLYSSIVLIDEVQGIPVEYWDLVAKVFEGMTQLFNCTFVIASATNPKVIFENSSLDKVDLFTQKVKLDRYVVRLDCFQDGRKKDTELSEFIEQLKQEKSESLLIVVNTRQCAFTIFDALQGREGLFLLSTQLLPVHRMEIIEEIKKRMNEGKPTTVVSTQVIEAGVDLSFEKVYRDFAPLDSIIQVSGRCNRHALMDDPGEVVLVSLVNNGRRFADLVYNKLQVNLETTSSLLSTFSSQISEEDISSLAEKYFKAVKGKRDSSNLLDEYLYGRFKILNHKFKLIEEMDGRVPVILELEENKKLIKELYFKKRIRYIPNRVRKYVIEVNQTVIKEICKQLEIHKDYRIFKEKSKQRGSDVDRNIYLIRLRKLSQPEKVYSRYGGVRMASLVTRNESDNAF